MENQVRSKNDRRKRGTLAPEPAVPPVLTQILLAIIRAHPPRGAAATEEARLAKALEALLGKPAQKGRKVIDDKEALKAMAEKAFEHFLSGRDASVTQLARESAHQTHGHSDKAVVARLQKTFLRSQNAIMMSMMKTDAELANERNLVLAVLGSLADGGVASLPPADEFKSPVISLVPE